LVFRAQHSALDGPETFSLAAYGKGGMSAFGVKESLPGLAAFGVCVGVF